MDADQRTNPEPLARVNQEPDAIAAAEAPLRQAPSDSTPLSTAMRSSILWMFGASIAIKFMSLLTQLVLGWLLTNSDFGIYYLATAIIGVLTVFREGGTRDYLIQQGPDKFNSLAGTVFWLTFTVSLACAAVAIGLSVLIWIGPSWLPVAYSDPRLAVLLLIGAVTLMIGAASGVVAARFQTDLRFDVVAKAQLVASAIRYILLVVLVFAGAGPIGWGLAMMFSAMIELTLLKRSTSMKLLQLPAEVHRWKGILKLTAWLILGAMANLLIDYGNFMAVGLFASAATLGIYSFSFNLVVQLVMLISVNVQTVLMPALSRIANDPERFAHVSVRSFRGVLAIGSGACMLFATVADPVMDMLWHGRWEVAIPAAIVFCLFFPMRMTFGVTMAMMQSTGRFKLWAILSSIEGVAMSVGAALGALWGGDALWIAVGAGGVLAIFRVAISAHLLARAGVGLRSRIAAIFGSWVLSIVAFVLVHFVFASIDSPAIWAWLSENLARTFHPRVVFSLVAFLHASVLGAAFGLTFVALLRVFLPEHARETTRMVPNRLRPLACKLLLLKQT